MIHEVFGGWGWQAVKLFHQLARCHKDKIDPALSTWACSTWTAYHTQRISCALHTRATAEIITHLHHAHTGGRRPCSRPAL